MSELTPKQQLLAQRIQNEQGWLIIAHVERHPIGMVLDRCQVSDRHPNKFPPLRVIGYATEEEYREQHRRFKRPLPESCIVEKYFHKVVAE